ncbi:4-hydroxyphenylacetate 3-monooxygenase [Methylopila jiangsuensis]|uniref:4-hydroxyphenylacetate 3-monooxygenase n=1 Tax=Methylopila jiangsuensis TaxID=586230 RepID=A0A9W6JH60_9HYPH|nr:flavin reductase [Methylopila jiangsuensis]MDR6286685.1 flavin reductase (DIM6/NTAB) family NADH-FMN oxidoreductase RutF [Methylopila jiangsuensis]GLK76972.1 4-hydroxyphenylacetate 3-monooxygenase [Methylopila jiangsuensis]
MTASVILPGLDGAAFRQAMAGVPMAVHVVATDGPAGRHGATATAVASVTDDPPTVLVCLNRASSIAARVKENGVAAVSALAAAHQPVAEAFARSSGGAPDGRFDVGDWDRLVTGAPALRGAVAVFDGRVMEARPVGSHLIVLLRLEAVRAGDAGAPGLIYRSRGYLAAASRAETPSSS